MKPSKRNQANIAAKLAKRQNKAPLLSKYAAKSRMPYEDPPRGRDYAKRPVPSR